MDECFASELSTANVYAFDPATGELSFAVWRPPSRPNSCSATSRARTYAPSPLNPNLQTSALEKGSSEIVEEIPTRGGQTVYFVAKLLSQAPPDQGFVDDLDCRIRRAKQQVMEMEHLVWQLEAVLVEDGEFDYEGYAIVSRLPWAYDHIST